MKTAQETNQRGHDKPGKDLLPEAVAEALEAVLWYLWEPVLQDFSENRGEEGEEDHIFYAVAAMNNWFEGGRPVSAEEWADDFEGPEKKAKAPG